MEYKAYGNDKGIRVDEQSPSAEYTRWCARGRTTALAAVDAGGRPAMEFVENEILVDDSDSGLVQQLIDQFGAEIIPPLAIPAPPDGLGPAPGVDAASMPLPTRLRMPAPPAASERAGGLLRQTYGDSVSVTSPAAAGILGVVADFASEGRKIGLNVVGRAVAFPLVAAAEGAQAPGGPDPFQWPTYAGKARVTSAWQLVEAYRKFRSLKPLVLVGCLDGGFWLNGKTPGIAPGQFASDFGTFAFQLNLLDESVGAGGGNPNKCGEGYTCPWHGNGVASVACASVGNGQGSAGVGGTVARPVMFKSELSVSQIFRCLQVCLAWGVDVLNMSFGKTSWELTFPTTSWNRSFQFAADNGLILVASAGNSTLNLPDDDNVRPATRTPGTITVGALDGNNSAAPYSNFGSSIDIWAPGDNLATAPDPDNPNGSPQSGTSMAAPFVSGIIAMMRAVKPSLNTFDAKQLLVNSGWRGEGKVNVGVDAFAAVLAAMGGQLPEDLAEPNNTPQTAAPLHPFGPGGVLVPLGQLGENDLGALSRRNDVDWYRLPVAEFSTVTLDLSFFPLLGTVRATIVPDDPDSRVETDLAANFSAGKTRLTGPVSAGGYKIRIDGSMNAYKLTVKLSPAVLDADELEVNNSFDQATHFHLRTPGSPPPAFPELFTRGPGRYELTLPQGDIDFFAFQVDAPGALPAIATAVFSETDAPLDVVLYDAAHQVLPHAPINRNGSLTLPQGVVSFVQVSSPKPTRYTMTVRYEIDKSHLPGPLQNETTVPLPDLGDPPFRVDPGMRHVFVGLTQQSRTTNRLVFGALNGAQLTAELLDTSLNVVATGTQAGDAMHNSVAIETSHLQLGNYLVRFGAAGLGEAMDVERLPALNVRR